MNESAHGTVGTHAENFCRLVPPRRLPFDDADLVAIAKEMDRPDTLSDGPDAEENLYVPAGYTYLGQFVDHDLTLETTSNLNPDDRTLATNLRTPAFDLDCIYGSGPADQAYLYEADLATLRIGRIVDDATKDDLLRNVDRDGNVDPNGRAIIGDKRNDENSIVSQVQLAMIKFHNKVVAHLAALKPPPANLFDAARDEVRWTYQRMLVEDYLRRIVEGEVYDAFHAQWVERGDGAYLLYPPELRDRIPLEFAGAAYRFGHSMVRLGYRLNATTALAVFTRTGESATSLTGFQPLPASHVIDDWGRFFPEPDRQSLWPGVRVDSNDGTSAEVGDGGLAGRPQVRLQFAYKIDPSVAAPLDDLPARISGFDSGKPVFLRPEYKGPALSLLNLRRGNKFQLASGQTVAAFIDGHNGHKLSDLEAADLQVRTDAAGGRWTFKPYPEGLRQSTPLWAYILAEAQRKIVREWAAPEGNHGADVPDDFFLGSEPAHTQLGPVGGRIVLETFFGLLDADRSSYLYAPSTWKPLVMKGKPGPVTFSRVLSWTGLTITDGFGK